ncbi:glycosyl transferase family 2 [Leptothrix cholodnii SP-6]|uniref:Glycosyl transferase family 2 n=1 Tax=Leptothrix cholodnii (strain ATCC 51168 / LMG 8142 / SP-6) TaxID=395495 RepID=B1Y729_LEPCP|nr:glycosyltransferase family 2 protein [Leptothrix cholodnii]ACB33656.1 glycosyl transferase family 2 [Leptothrix cholodnii SP-6]
MDLSIIIVNWNSREFLRKALASIPESTSALSVEIIVIDSGSFDGCAEMLRQEHPQVRFIQAGKNLGFARANNAAFEVSRGEVLLFLNPDTEVIGAAIEALYWQLVNTPDAAIVGPKLLNSDGSVQDTCVRAFPTILNQMLDCDWLRRRFPGARLWGKQALLRPGRQACRVDAVSGACLMIKRAPFEAIGRFSTDYFMYAEDMALCLKAARAGFGICFVPAAVVVHHGGASSSQARVNTFSAVMAVESQWRFFRNTRSPRYAMLYRAALFGASALRVGVLLLIWPLQALFDRRAARSNAWPKWLARLRWAAGGERWARNDQEAQP